MSESNSLDRVCTVMSDFLNAKGIAAVTAWSKENRKERKDAVCVVSLRGFQGERSGFHDYLGQQFDAQCGWRDIYGMKATLTFGLDIYAGIETDECGMEAAFHRLAAVLAICAPDGLAVQEISCKETEYDQSGQRMKRTVNAVCAAYLYATEEPGGAFVDFEIRGGIKQ